MENKNVKEMIPFVPENNSVQVCSRDHVHRIHDANDPVVLYKSLIAAKETVRISANSKLSALGKQMDFLIKEANKIVEQSKRDEQLHNIPCNFKKIAGNVYYLYKRGNGTEFFSMLSPDEWGRQLNNFEYVGGYRLDGDYGFTCVDGAEDEGREEERYRQIFKRIGY
ncbi:unnamed protein product [Bursaphelenchus xylophilus]|uniref:(pine wood nematode) hypothetical protein n=1 Tax=Bursaphelenchus xylophilus TaxID=6326 RepID=A0A1I7SSF8_BURXY|nr:unnamed protein product [Bursaphelenchus xylophilus]CAG9097595.1 unnamed protein product [Bursaphelenchus xylophilus]